MLAAVRVEGVETAGPRTQPSFVRSPFLAPTGVRSSGSRFAAAPAVALGGLTACGLAVALGAAAEPSFLIFGNPAIPAVPTWLRTPLAGLGPALGPTALSVLVLAMAAGYLGVIARVDALRPAWAVASVVALHLAFLAAPPLLSGDVFSYLAYARLDILHGLDPYLHAAEQAAGDPILPYVGMKDVESPYGPLFTLTTLTLVPFGIPAGIWALKVTTVAASLAVAALVWSCARRLGRAPLGPTLFVVLNPVYLVYALGGAHNDLLVAVPLLAGVRLALGTGPTHGASAPTSRAREVATAALLTLGAAVKATAGVALPFFVVAAHRRHHALAASLAAGALLAGLAVLAFGAGAFAYLGVLARQGQLVSKYSVWLYLSHAAGLPTLPGAAKVGLSAAFLLVLAVTLVRTWRGDDWLVGTGWAAVALLVTTTWLLPWYVVLVLPFAALGSSRSLRVAAHVVTALILLTRLPLLLA